MQQWLHQLQLVTQWDRQKQNNNTQMLFDNENKIRRNSDTTFSTENLILFMREWQDFNGNLTLF